MRRSEHGRRGGQDQRDGVPPVATNSFSPPPGGPAPAPPAGFGRRRRHVLVLAMVVAGAAVGVLALSPGGHAPPSGPILSVTSAGAVVPAAADGSVTAALPSVNGTGFLVAADGRYLATGTGQEFVLRGATLAATGGDIPFVGPPGSWRAVDFTDADRGLVATEDSPGTGLVAAEAVTFTGSRTVGFGSAESVVGDPGALGVFVVVIAGERQAGPPVPVPPAETRIERRDAGAPPVVLATAAHVLDDLGDNPGTAAALSVVPDPRGDRIAVVVVPVSAPPGRAGIVVLSRDGHSLGAVQVANQGVGRPAWSPDGSSLVYDASTAGRPALAVWRIGHRPMVHLAPSGPSTASGFGNCLWAPTGNGFLCADSDSGQARAAWLVGRTARPSLVRVLGPPIPLAWLRSSGSSTPTDRARRIGPSDAAAGRR